MAINYEMAEELADGMRANIKLQNSISFADMPYIPPDIDIFHDAEQYYDPARNQIHLGSHGIVDIFQPEDEAEYISALDYVRGHEEQHRRSTANVPYSWAVSRGCEVILEKISGMVEKSIRKFRTEKDYQYFANEILPSMGIYISWSMVRNIVASLANSIEDGRIERIRSNRFPGFESKRLYFRGKFWTTQTTKFKAYSKIKDKPAEKLQIIMNQILSLATCQMYQKGFKEKYAGTPLKNEVDDLMPYIGKGVMAPKTRAMAYEVVKLCEKLAPYIFETCRLAQKDVEAMKCLEDMIRDMIKSILDNMPEGNQLSEQHEDTDDGSANSTFPQSDLVIELDDEDYDKLIKNSKKSNDSNSGIMIKRKHPKPDEETDEKSEKKESGKPSDGGKSDGKKEDSKEAQSGGSADGEPSDENKEKSNGKSNGGSSEKNEPSDGSSSKNSGNDDSQDGSANQNCDADDNQDGPTNQNCDADDSSDENSSSHGSIDNQSSSSEGKSAFKDDASKEEKDAALNAVLDAMKEAADVNRETAKVVASEINAGRAHEHKMNQRREMPDTSKPVTEQMKDICDFKELKRAYQLTSTMEPVDSARAKALRRKNERYFRSLSTPNVTYLDSGSIDPTRIYGLAMGDTEIFRKKGKDRVFDGCAYILLDNSGSMRGNKRLEACRATAIMEEAFKGLIPMKIVAFDENRQIIHEVVKNWDEVTNKNCSWNFCLHGRDGAGNEDGYDIKIATRELLSRPERKKLLIVMSDGAPGNCQFAHDAVEAARKAGIQVSAIFFDEGGIEGYSVDRFNSIYTKDCYAVELSALDATLGQILQKFTRK